MNSLKRIFWRFSIRISHFAKNRQKHRFSWFSGNEHVPHFGHAFSWLAWMTRQKTYIHNAAYSVNLFFISVRFLCGHLPLPARCLFVEAFAGRHLSSIHIFQLSWNSAVAVTPQCSQNSSLRGVWFRPKNETIILFGTICRLPSPSPLPWRRMSYPNTFSRTLCINLPSTLDAIGSYVQSIHDSNAPKNRVEWDAAAAAQVMTKTLLELLFFNTRIPSILLCWNVKFAEIARKGKTKNPKVQTNHFPPFSVHTCRAGTKWRLALSQWKQAEEVFLNFMYFLRNICSCSRIECRYFAENKEMKLDYRVDSLK